MGRRGAQRSSKAAPVSKKAPPAKENAPRGAAEHPRRGPGRKIDRHRRGVKDVVERVPGAAAVDLPRERLAGAELEFVRQGAAGQVADAGVGDDRVQLAAVGAGDRPVVDLVEAGERVERGRAAAR